MKRPISVVCIKWGTPYPAEYVNVLQRAVSDHLSYDHRFVCITDTPQGISDAVEVMPLPEIPIARSQWNVGYWPKLAIFKKGMFADDEIVLYLDVDNVISESLDPLVELVDQQQGLRIIREWNPDLWRLLPVWLRPDRGGNGSVIGFIAGEQTHLFDDFCMAPEEIDETYIMDQVYITERGAGRKYWPDRWCTSFRRTCVPHWPLKYLHRKTPKPPWAKIFVFHGVPNPTDVIAEGHYRWGRRLRGGVGPVKWVQEYWHKYES